MAERPSHKRTRSALALSLLYRDKSKNEPDPNAPSSATASDNESSIDSPSTESPVLSLSSPLSQIRSARSKPPLQAEPPRSTTGGADVGQAPAEQRQSSDGDVAASGLGQSDMSIEQSVKTFRIFEALRSGDTTAISKTIKESGINGGGIQGTTVLHLAIQCADPAVVEYVLSSANDAQGNKLDINARDKEGNTPIHLAAQLGRAPIVQQLLEQEGINDSVANYHGRTPLDLARTPEIFQLLQLSRSIFLDAKTKEVHSLVAKQDYEELEKLLVDPRVEAALDVNNLELATDQSTIQTGGTLLHEAARKRDTKLAQILLMHGADPFRRDRKGKLPQDVTKDDRTRGILKKSPAAVMAQRGIQEKAILGNTSGQRPGQGPGDTPAAGKDGREMKGYLKKWTNYTTGYKLRWFVLEDGVLSYYKHQGE
jgi:ankyrin repeat protein